MNFGLSLTLFSFFIGLSTAPSWSQVSTYKGSEAGLVTFASSSPLTIGNVVTEGLVRLYTVTAGRFVYQQMRADLQAIITKSLNQQSAYLPNKSENDRRTQNVMKGVDQILGNTGSILSTSTLSVSQLRAALKYVHGAVIDQIVPAVLRKEVFSSSGTGGQQIETWKTRFKTNVNTCVDGATYTQEALNCFLNGLSTLQTNLGIAIVSETSRKSLEPMVAGKADHYRACRTEDYLSCLGIRSQNSPRDCPKNTYPIPDYLRQTTKTCATRAIQNGIMVIAPPAILESVRKSAPPEIVSGTTELAVGTLRGCLTNKGSEAEFVACFDRTIMVAGEKIVEAKIKSEPTVREAFPNPRDRLAISSEAIATFKLCAANLQKKGIRKGNLLDVESCEQAVKAHVARAVMEATFKAKDLPSSKFAISALSSCWPGDLGTSARVNACLKKSLIAFAQTSADQLISDRTPLSLRATDPRFVQREVSLLTSCLQASLPEDILSGSQLEPRIEGCSQKTTLNVARSVARHEVAKVVSGTKTGTELESFLDLMVDRGFMACLGKDATNQKIEICEKELKTRVAKNLARSEISVSLEGQMSPEKLEALLSVQVDEHFLTCLGDNPTPAKIDVCSNTLRHDVGLLVGQALIPKSLRDYKTKAGTPAQVEAISSKVVKSLESCLDQNRARLATELNPCFRQTIQAAVGEMGALELRSQLDQYLAIAPTLDIAKIEGDLKLMISTCLRDGVPEDAPLKMTIDRIDPCAQKVSAQIKNNVASDLITLSASPLDRIISEYEKCLKSHAKACREKLTEAVNTFMKPFRTIGGSCEAPSQNPLEANMYDLAGIGIVSLIVDGQGHFDEVRAEVKTLVSQFAGIAASEGPKNKEELVADPSTDPLLQSLIRGILRGTMASMPGDQLPPSLIEKLTNPQLIEEIFDSRELQKIKRSAANLAENTIAGNTPQVQINTKDLQTAIGRAYFSSDKVKALIFQGQIDRELKHKGPLVKLLAPMFAGVMGYDLNWERVRKKPAGKAAEAWVMENVVFPMLDGTVTDPAKMQLLQKEAARRIQDSMRGK